MTRAKEFFTSTVKPTVDEFLNDVKDIRRGRLAAIVRYHMADYWHLENKAVFKDLEKLCVELTKICPEFLIIGDVADASKHAELRNGSRQLTRSEQVTMSPGLFQAPFGVGVFAKAMEVIVTLNDLTSRPFAPVVRSVLSMWEAVVR